VRANPKAAGSATGITQTGVYLGALSGPLVFGVVVDQAGYSTAWLVITGAALAAAAVFFVADRRLEPAAPRSSAGLSRPT
jgi:sugar phosphate permease